MTKYGMVKTDHILFIASGAFHVSKPSDLIPELQGRFPIRVELSSLTEEDFVKILTLPQNALIKQYAALLETEGLKIEFREDGIREIAKIASEVNEQVENIGARRLHTIMTTLLEDVLYNAPDDMPQRTVVVDQTLVQSRLVALVKNRDLSRYILYPAVSGVFLISRSSASSPLPPRRTTFPGSKRATTHFPRPGRCRTCQGETQSRAPSCSGLCHRRKLLSAAGETAADDIPCRTRAWGQR